MVLFQAVVEDQSRSFHELMSLTVADVFQFQCLCICYLAIASVFQRYDSPSLRPFMAVR